MSAVEAFIRDRADIISPIPGEALSDSDDESAGVSAFDESVDSGNDDPLGVANAWSTRRRGGGADRPLSATRSTERCFFSTSSGIARARLVPMNCDYCTSVYFMYG